MDISGSAISSTSRLITIRYRLTIIKVKLYILLSK